MDAESRMWDRLFRLIHGDNWDQTVYVYLVDRMGKIIKPYRAKWAMHYGLLDRIRDELGAGLYHLMIREGKTMVFTGTIGIAPKAGEPWPPELL
jgi:hypothetical protein